MPSVLKTLFALALISALGLAAIGNATSGFRAVSSEDVRRLAVQEQPRTIPATDIAFAFGTRTTLQQALRDDGRVAIVAFVYTRCNAICTILGTEFQQLQRAINERGLSNRVRLINISFDPAETPAHLARYASSLHANPHNWQFAMVADAAQRKALLDTFDIVVVPAPLGQFQHNAAFHLVAPDARLSRIIDFDDPEAALTAASGMFDEPRLSVAGVS